MSSCTTIETIETHTYRFIAVQNSFRRLYIMSKTHPNSMWFAHINLWNALAAVPSAQPPTRRETMCALHLKAPRYVTPMFFLKAVVISHSTIWTGEFLDAARPLVYEIAVGYHVRLGCRCY